MMTPSVNGNMMSPQVFTLKDSRKRNGTRADHEKRGLEIDRIQVVKQLGGVKCWAIVISQTPGLSIGALGNISVTSAATTSPPAAAGILNRIEIGGTTA